MAFAGIFHDHAGGLPASQFSGPSQERASQNNPSRQDEALEVLRGSIEHYFNTEFTQHDRDSYFYSSHYNEQRLECLILVHETMEITAVFDPIEKKHIASELRANGSSIYIDSPFDLSSDKSRAWFQDLMTK